MTTTTRPRHKMPGDVADALKPKSVRTAYDERPAYQRNDYLGWITEAKQPETRSKRIDQMVDELKRGDVYMKMAWNGAKDD
jgi:uncharacterized protein YdeI (YjbR/CyaY-like superfamily)